MHTFLTSGALWTELIAKWCIALYLGLAFLFPFRCRFINLGIGAQMIAAALALTYVGHFTGSWVLASLAALVVSVCVATLPVLAKRRFGTDEILTTLFMSYMAIPVAQALMRATSNHLTVASPELPENASLSWARIGFNLSLLHFGALVVLFAGLFFLEHSVAGYMAKVGREQPVALGERRYWSITLLCSAIGGLCSTGAVLADVGVVKLRYLAGDYDVSGFAGVAVGLMALGNVRWLALAAFGVAAIDMTFLVLSVERHFPQMTSQALYGVGILATAAAWRWRVGNIKSSHA